MKDLHNNVAVEQALKPQDTSSDQDGETIDLQGYESVEFIVNHEGGNAGETIEFDLEESSDGSNWSAVADSDILGEEYSEENPDAEAAKIGYIGDERYVRVTHTADSTSVVVGAVAVKSNARHKPE